MKVPVAYQIPARECGGELAPACIGIILPLVVLMMLLIVYTSIEAPVFLSHLVQYKDHWFYSWAQYLLPVENAHDPPYKLRAGSGCRTQTTCSVMMMVSINLHGREMPRGTSKEFRRHYQDVKYRVLHKYLQSSISTKLFVPIEFGTFRFNGCLVSSLMLSICEEYNTGDLKNRVV